MPVGGQVLPDDDGSNEAPEVVLNDNGQVIMLSTILGDEPVSWTCDALAIRQAPFCTPDPNRHFLSFFVVVGDETVLSAHHIMSGMYNLKSTIIRLLHPLANYGEKKRLRQRSLSRLVEPRLFRLFEQYWMVPCRLINNTRHLCDQLRRLLPGNLRSLIDVIVGVVTRSTKEFKHAAPVVQKHLTTIIQGLKKRWDRWPYANITHVDSMELGNKKYDRMRKIFLELSRLWNADIQPCSETSRFTILFYKLSMIREAVERNAPGAPVQVTVHSQKAPCTRFCQKFHEDFPALMKHLIDVDCDVVLRFGYWSETTFEVV